MVKQDRGTQTIREFMSWELEDRTRLLLQLYEKAMRCMDQAVVHIEAGAMVKKSEELIRAQDIVLQLSDALDHQCAAGGLTTNLARLYLYIYRLLIAGNTRLDLASIAEAKKHMAQLYTAWVQVRERAALPVGLAARARW